MKNQALFSWKDKSKKLKCRLLQFLFGALKVKSGICAGAVTSYLEVKPPLLTFLIIWEDYKCNANILDQSKHKFLTIMLVCL